MSMWHWLSGNQRLEGLARINAAWRRLEESEREQAPMREVTGRVIAMVHEAEMRGGRPTTLYLSEVDWSAVERGVRAMADDLVYDPRLRGEMKLMGLDVRRGPVTRVE